MAEEGISFLGNHVSLFDVTADWCDSLEEDFEVVFFVSEELLQPTSRQRTRTRLLREVVGFVGGWPQARLGEVVGQFSTR
ncbi:hypothetical protein D3C87_2021010 [compost metagenome]